MEYRHYASTASNLNGALMVSFKVTKEGKLMVLKVNNNFSDSVSPEVSQQVLKQKKVYFVSSEAN